MAGFLLFRFPHTIEAMPVSAVIITLNEEKNIADAIRSVDWADEILVVDSESTDRTREIAESLGARVLRNPWPGFSKQKQYAVDHASHDWIVSLDADERVSKELQAELKSLIAAGPSADGYKIPRLTYYMQKPIRHGGWYPDHQLRFFDRRKGEWNGSVIHESVKMSGDAKVGVVRSDLIHYTVESADEHQRMITERYAPLGAKKMYDEGRRTSTVKAVFASWFAFLRAYFLKLGLLDGFPGFCIAYFSAHHAFLKHLMLLELQRSSDKR